MKKTFALLIGLSLTALSFGQSLKISKTPNPKYGNVLKVNVTNEYSHWVTLEIADYAGEVIYSDEFNSSYDKRFAFDLPKSVLAKGVIITLVSNGGKIREKYLVTL